MILALLKYLLLIFPISSIVTIKSKFKQEESVLIVYLGSLFLLYLCGLINLLNIGLNIIVILAIISTVYCIYSIVKKKIKINELITFPIVMYILSLIVLCFYLNGNGFHEWDELSHWGTNLKFMVSKDLLWANKQFNGIHIVYQPLIGIAEWLLNKMNGEFAEDVSYLGYEIFAITLILPLMKNLKYKIGDVLKVLLYFSIFIMIRLLFGFQLITIYIDFVLALLFGISFYISMECKERKDYLILGVLLITLVLLKDTGLIFAGIIIMYIFMTNVISQIIEEKRISKQIIKKVGVIIGALVILVCIYMSWKIYCNINGQKLDIGHDHNYIEQNFDVRDLISTILLRNTASEKSKDIFYSFVYYLVDFNIVTFFIELSPIKIIALLNVLAISICVFSKNKENLKQSISMILSFDIGLVLYMLVLLSTFLYAMTDVEGYRLASFDRYLNTYFLAWTLVSILILIERQKFLKNKIICLLIINLLLFSNTNVFSIIYERNCKTDVTEEMVKLSEKVQEIVNEDEKIYLIVQNSSQKFIQHQMRFLLSPISTNDMSQFSLGEKYGEDDYDSLDITVEEWGELLIQEKYDYVLIVDADESFYKRYSSIFENPGNSVKDIQWKLFKVENSEKVIKLIEK